MIKTDGWCKLEGAVVSDPVKTYGTFVNLPVNIPIWYTMPEIRLYNPNSTVLGVVYKAVPISELLSGTITVQTIDAAYSTLLYNVANYDKEISPTKGAINYYEPFDVDEPSIIFYDQSTATQYSHWALVMVDLAAQPRMIAITAHYDGQPIPIGDTFDKKDLVIEGIYEDGQAWRILDNYTITPNDQIVTAVGSNAFTIEYNANVTDIDLVGDILKTTVIVLGIKKLVGISALYDGPPLSYGDEAKRKYFVVIAHYSDGSQATVGDFSFPNGNTITSIPTGATSFDIRVFYKGFYTDVPIPLYDVTTSMLMAYYNGPPVEVGDVFDINNCKIKIYYASSDGLNDKYEDVDPNNCVFSTTTIDHEGLNYITVQFNGKAGPISTKMVVVGFKPEIVMTAIRAEYTGPPIEVGKTFSKERVIVKAYYSNGQVITIGHGAFTIDGSMIVNSIGDNAFVVWYTDKDVRCEDTIIVPGVGKDTTSEDGYTPITLDNHYPEGTRYNSRYRGPAEAVKIDHTDMMIREMIHDIHDIFGDIEDNFYTYVGSVEDHNANKYGTINHVQAIEDNTRKWLTDKRFISGHYVKEDEDE